MWTRLLWAGYGVLATLAGLRAAHLTAALTDPATSPVLAVGSTVIDLTPTPAKEWAIRTFGSADKVVLVGSVLTGVAALHWLAGAQRRDAAAHATVLLDGEVEDHTGVGITVEPDDGSPEPTSDPIALFAFDG